MQRINQILFASLLILMCTCTSFAESPSQKTVHIAAFSLYPAIFKAQDNSIQGFYVDFISEIAKREGWKVEYIYGNWADGLARIKSGDVDILTSVTWTQERTAYMDFGKVPLNTVWSELYVHEKSSIDNIRQVQDKKIAIMKGDTNGGQFRNLVEKFGIPCQLLEYGNFDEIFKAIASREVDGGVVNNTYGAAKQSEFSVKSSGVIFNPFDIYFAVAKGENHKLLETFDKYLTEWRADKNSPYHLARQKWSHGNIGQVRIVPEWVKNALIGLTLTIIIGAAFIILLRVQVRQKTSKLSAQVEEREKIEETLFFINEIGFKHKGDEFLSALTAHLAGSLGVEYAFVSKLLPNGERLRTRGLHAMGARVDDIEYDLLGSPCNNVLGKEICYYPEDVISLFPDDRLLVDLEAAGYAGCPLWDSHGIGLGLIGIISKRPLENRALVETIVQIIGTRAAQEIEAMGHLEKLMLKDFTIENIADAVFWIHSDGRIWDTNEAACKLLAYTEQELLSKGVMDFDQVYSQESWPAHWVELKKAGNLRFESTHKDKHGRVFAVEINGSFFTFNGMEYCCSIVHDISKRKESEIEKQNLLVQLNQAQRIESIGVLAGGIAHDFNNILTAIMGNISHAIMDLDASQHAREPLLRAEKAVIRATGLAKQLLIFAKGGDPVKKFFSVPERLNDVVSLVLSGTAVRAVIDLPADLHAVNADEGQISQAFDNIIINAVQAMPNGGNLTISANNIAITECNNLGISAGDYVQMSFTDEGCGIDAENLVKIFDPYFTNKTGGSGLGLASTYAIIKKHEGNISVSSTPGKGTTFTILIPSCGKLVNEEEKAVHALEIAQKNHSILVMDDDEMVRELAEITLKRLGYKVVCCDNGISAVTLYRSAREGGEPFSLVIMDLTIPGGIGGVEAAKQILAFDPAAQLIVSSGYSADPVMANFCDYGFCASLEKPYNVAEIASILQKAKQG